MTGLRISGSGLLALAIGCGGEDVPLVEPAPAGAIVSGDANGDGIFDLSDAVWVSSTLFRGGADAPCFAAADLLAEGELNAADVYALLSAALPGLDDRPALAADACAYAGAPEVPAAARLRLALDAPEEVSESAGHTAEIAVSALLWSPERDVQAWTLSVEAEGCVVSALSTDGTDAALEQADPPGQRGPTSYNYQAITPEGGAVAGLVLDWRGDQVLEARQDPWTLLHLTVHATAPQKGCADCVLRLKNGASAGGPPLRNAVTLGGWTYPLPGSEATVQVCAE